MKRWKLLSDMCVIMNYHYPVLETEDRLRGHLHHRKRTLNGGQRPPGRLHFLPPARSSPHLPNRRNGYGLPTLRSHHSPRERQGKITGGLATRVKVKAQAQGRKRPPLNERFQNT